MTTDRLPNAGKESGHLGSAPQLTGPRARARAKRSAQGRTQDSARPTGLRQHNIRLLFVARESSEYEYELLKTMLEQILSPYKEMSAVKSVLEQADLIMRPGPDGDRARRRLQARKILSPGTRKIQAVLIVIGDVAFLIGLVSAGSTTEQMTNHWVDTVKDVVASLRPETLVTGPFSRLVRNQYVAGPLAMTLSSTHTKVQCAEWPGGVVLGDRTGDQVWSMLVSFAHQEWLATNMRLLTGTLFDLKNNRLPRAECILPLGYHMVTTGIGKKRSVQPNLKQRRLVRDFITWGASDMPSDEIIRRLGQRGVRVRSGKRKDDGQRPLIHEAKNPESALTHLYAHLPTYLDGRYVYAHGNPIPDLQELHGLTVIREHEKDKGVFEVVLDFGIPPGGWHDREVIQAAIARRVEGDGRSKATTRGTDRLPLTGLLRTVEDGTFSRLGARDAHYDLRCRPWTDVDEADAGKATLGAREGTVLAHMRARDFHHAVAGALRRIVDRQLTDVVCPEHVDQVDEAAQSAEAERLQATAEGLWETAAIAKDKLEKETLNARASLHFQAAQSIRENQARRAELMTLRDATVLPASTAQVFALAELLERFPGIAPVAVNLAARKVIGDLRVQAVPGTRVATFQIWVDVHTAAGPLRLGPIEGECPNFARARRALPDDPVPPRHVSTVVERLLSDDPAAAASAEGRPNPITAHEYARDGLEGLLPTSAATSRLVDCPIRAARAAILAGVLPEVAVPDELDSGYVLEMQSVYLDPKFGLKGRAWVSKDATKARQALAWVARNGEGERGVRVDRLCAAVELDPVSFGRMLATKGYDGKRFGTRALLEPTQMWPAYQTMDPDLKCVRVPACPHCGKRTLLQVLSVPELPDGVLCTECLRAPSTRFVYPAEYLQPWVGPHKREGARPAAAGDKVGSHLRTFVVPPRARAA